MVWLEERLLIAPPTQEVGCGLLLHCGLPVGFRWSVKISWRMGLLEEQDGAVVPSFWSIEYIKCTLPALAATPLQRTWLNESGWLSFTSFMWFTRSFVLHVSVTAVTRDRVREDAAESCLRRNRYRPVLAMVAGATNKGSHLGLVITITTLWQVCTA